jgi:signal transduction histidine kinase
VFARARRRLTLLYVAMFTLAIAVFSLAFLVLIVIVLEPDFDLTSDAFGEQAAQVAYRAAVERIGLALVVADVIAVAFIGVGAWLLAARTLKPISEAHERQRRFVADASHEMRTPLTAIRATTENALRPGTSADEQRAALGTVAVASAELASLTADLLTLAQSSDASARPPEQRLDLSVVVAERLELYFSANPGQRIKTSLTPGLLVSGSPDDVGRVFDSLVDNAFRYGGDGVQVSVATISDNGQAIVAVSDDGPGIAAADMAHIFEPFYRVRSDATAPSGTGLGLAIADALARSNRGRLTVDSDRGRGSTFRLSLPLAG